MMARNSQDNYEGRKAYCVRRQSGLSKPKVTSPFTLKIMERGRILEPHGLKEAVDYLRLQRGSEDSSIEVPGLLCSAHPGETWKIGTPDGIYRDEWGEVCIEMKAPGDRAKWYKKEEVKRNHFFQLLWYMHITGIEYGILFAYLPGQKNIVWHVNMISPTLKKIMRCMVNEANDYREMMLGLIPYRKLGEVPEIPNLLREEVISASPPDLYETLMNKRKNQDECNSCHGTELIKKTVSMNNTSGNAGREYLVCATCTEGGFIRFCDQPKRQKTGDAGNYTPKWQTLIQENNDYLKKIFQRLDNEDGTPGPS